MSVDYRFEAQGRKPATAMVLLALWAVLLAAYVWLDAAPIILALVGLFTLPALYDFCANPRSGLSLDATHLRWHAGRQTAQIALSEIDHLRFDTRLDLSVRLSVVRPSGVKIRVPYAATPPVDVIEQAAKDAGLRTQRHHFSLMG